MLMTRSNSFWVGRGSHLCDNVLWKELEVLRSWSYWEVYPFLSKWRAELSEVMLPIENRNFFKLKRDTFKSSIRYLNQKVFQILRLFFRDEALGLVL